MKQQSINRYMQGVCIDCGGPRRSHGGKGRCRACDVARRAVVHPVCACGKVLDADNKTATCAACRCAQGRARAYYARRAATPSPTRPQTNRPLTTTQRARADLLVQAVCAVYGVTLEQLQSVSRLTVHTEPRQMLMFLLTSKAGLSYAQAATLLRRDHTTAIHGRGKAARLIRERPQWAAAYRQIRDHYRAARAEALGVRPRQETPRTFLDDYYQARRLQHRDVVSYASEEGR